jgi:hypothetical protein
MLSGMHQTPLRRMMYALDLVQATLLQTIQITAFLVSTCNVRAPMLLRFNANNSKSSPRGIRMRQMQTLAS